MNKSLLMGMMEPPAGFEEEFNDWYDTEHTPKVSNCPGFETGQRFTCTSGWPRYVALYDLTNLDVLRSPTYQKLSDKGASPWTQRVRDKTLGRYRFLGNQIYPGNALLGEKGAVNRLLVLRFERASDADGERILHGLRENFTARKGVSQFRLFRDEKPEQCTYAAIVEFFLPANCEDIDPAPFGDSIRLLNMTNVYSPYWRVLFRKP
jgi:hypothetical protein